jgi:hypothetical protein
MKKIKPRVLLFGNCQGNWLVNNLRQKSELTLQHEIIYIASNPKSPLEGKIGEPEFIATCSHMLWQTAAGCKPPPFVSTLPPHVRQIRFPTLCIKWLWPMHIVDPARHIKEPGFPDGRFSYGDRLLMKLLADGISVGDLHKRYVETDLNKMFNLDRYREIAAAELRFNDKQSDIPITELVEKTFQAHQTFSAVNHPNPIILDHLSLALAAAILDRPVDRNLNEPTDMSDILGHQEIPIHPQIAEHFKLQWIRPDMTWRYGAEQLTLEEYVVAYGNCAPIPYQEGPRIWLDRAIKAIARKDIREAERLLLKGAALYPAVIEFFRSLGSLYAEQKRLLDAEKVYRYALTAHPQAASLYSDLGIIMFQRRFPEEAARMFSEALRIDPKSKEAHNNMQLALKACKLLAPPARS